MFFISQKIINEDEQIKIKKDEQQLKLKMSEFFEELKKYMEDNKLNDDKFLKNLCDDIYISHKTLGTKYSGMYTTARLTSQGTQRCYTVSQTPDDPSNILDQIDDEFPFQAGNNNNVVTSSTNNIMPPLLKTRWNRQGRLKRTTNRKIFDDFTEDNNDNDNVLNLPILKHNVSDFDDTPYLTPLATRLMRDVSSGHSYEENIFVEEENIEESQIN